jgi:predicted transcriptional regulator
MPWCPITGSDDPMVIQWSPKSGKNLRAKNRGDEDWRYGSCSKAHYALALGQRLLVKEPEINLAEIQRRKMVEN